MCSEGTEDSCNDAAFMHIQISTYFDDQNYQCNLPNVIAMDNRTSVLQNFIIYRHKYYATWFSESNEPNFKLFSITIMMADMIVNTEMVASWRYLEYLRYTVFYGTESSNRVTTCC